ncbi:hypothetical protein IAQ61_012008 [Plenodomus lingam]|uniref:uncharacterized protein n=1 Tax=Leptosphaeria maculans TaxID=5022 RepID=UPI003325CA29|nr:hypothetical protein IAQ61_012008 [Plenodomus lingam]
MESSLTKPCKHINAGLHQAAGSMAPRESALLTISSSHPPPPPSPPALLPLSLSPIECFAKSSLSFLPHSRGRSGRREGWKTLEVRKVGQPHDSSCGGEDATPGSAQRPKPALHAQFDGIPLSLRVGAGTTQRGLPFGTDIEGIPSGGWRWPAASRQRFTSAYPSTPAR